MTEVRFNTKDPRQVLAAYKQAEHLERDSKPKDAARIYLALAKVRKAPMSFFQIVASGLNRTGHSDEAEALSQRTVEARSRTLPDTLAEALDRLPGKLDHHVPHPAALEWAWQHRDPGLDITRTEFERRVRWGIAADFLLLDWLECRGAEGVGEIFDGAEPWARELKHVREKGNGLCMASAHFGAVFAPSLIYEKFDVDITVIGGFTKTASNRGAKRLLSSTDHDRVALYNAANEVVASGGILSMAIDGSLSGRPIDFGRDGLPGVRISPLLAKLVYRHRCPSVFRAALWDKGRVRIETHCLPDPEGAEPFDSFFARWTDAYCDAVAQILTTIAPENLRLNSGLWRGIKHL